MKLTLNSVVPAHRRKAVEQHLTRVVPGGVQVCWLPSRFPRLVMLVEPGEATIGQSAGSSIFDDREVQGAGDFSAELEESIQKFLAATVTC